MAVNVDFGPRAVRRAIAELRALPGGTPVVLLDRRPGGRFRARRIASAGALLIDRQYVAIPSLRQAILVADDSRDSLRWAFRSLVAPPPGITWAHVLLDTAVKLLRWRPEMVSWVGAGRVVVGRTA